MATSWRLADPLLVPYRSCPTVAAHESSLQCGTGSATRAKKVSIHLRVLAAPPPAAYLAVGASPATFTPRAALARRRPRLSLSSSPRNTAWPQNPCLQPCQGDG